VESAESSLSRAAGDIALNEAVVEAMSSEFLLTPGAREETAFVLEEFWADFENAG
jgi:hypothetical protein